MRITGRYERPSILVVGLGHPDRGDDAVGIEAARRAVELIGPSVHLSSASLPIELPDHWAEADVAVVVDAIRSGAPPGTVLVAELGDHQSPLAPYATSLPASGTHDLGLAWALQMSQKLGTAPGRVVLVGIEGHDFSPGAGLSDPVAAAVPDAVRAVVEALQDSPGLDRVQRSIFRRLNRQSGAPNA